MGVSLQELLDERGPLGSFCRPDSGLHTRAMREVVGVDLCLLGENGSGVVKDECREVEGEKCVQFDDGRVADFE